MEIKPIDGKYIQVSVNKSMMKQQMQTLRFLTSFVCLFFIVILFQQKAVAQTLGINTTGAIPDSSAMLDIISSNKGLLIPRVSLTSTTDTITIADPATSLLVYNTNASMTGGGGLGYYYYNGSSWVNFLNSTSSSIATPLIIGGTSTTSSLTYKPTTGVGTTGADHIFKVGNNGATEAMRILNNGSIGIGLTNPAAKISVDANTSTYVFDAINIHSSVSSIFSLQSGNAVETIYKRGAFIGLNNITDPVTGLPINRAGTYGASAIGFGAYSTRIGFFTSTNTTINSALTERMTIMGAGNVGIGTTAPACKLEINDADKTVLDLYRYNNFAINTTDAFAINKGGAISFGGTYFTGSPTLYGFGAIKGAKEDATSGLINGYLAFITTAAGIGSREWMRISSTGNIGIGTSAPTAKTQISGDFDASTINANALVIDAKLRTSTTNGLDKAGILVTPDFNTTNSNVANTYGIKIAPIQTGVYTTTNGYGLHVTAPTVTSGFLTNSYAASFNGGNVGIGTTAPPVMLTVLNSNSVKAAIAQSLTDVTTAPTTIATANYLQLGRQEFGTNSYRLIQFGYNSAAITNSPAYMGFQETTQTGVTKGDLVFGTRDVTTNTQASERMRILANGNVGIGTTSPAAKLEVMGANNVLARFDFTSSRGVLRLINNSMALANTTDLGIDFTPTTGNPMAGIYSGWQESTSNAFLAFKTSSDGGTTLPERIRITSTGNVGIGTTTPNSTLQVNGAFSLPIVNVTGNYTVLSTDYTIYVSGGSAGVTTTVTLPTLVAGRIYVIKNASLGDVSLVGTIDSGTNLTISAAAMNPPQPVMVQGLGGAIGWVVISRQ